MARFSDIRLGHFRVELQVMRLKCEATVRRLRAEITRYGELHRVGDPLDNAQDIEGMSTTAELSEASVRELRAIALAVERINTRTYGVCSDCDETIADKRLIANPLAIRCRDCQEAVESRSSPARHVPVYP